MDNYQWRAVEARDSSPVVVEYQTVYQTVYHAGLPDEHILCISGSVETAHAIAKAMEIMNSCFCLMNLNEDEPFFVLRGQDMSSPEIILQWLIKNSQIPNEKFEDAIMIVMEMRNYKHTKAAD